MDDKLYNSQRIPKMLEKDGVIYAPSGAAPPAHATAETSAAREPQPERGPSGPKRKMKPQRSQLMLFYVITLVIGVVISVAVFGIVLNYFTNNTPPVAQAPLPPHLSGTPEVSPGLSFAEKIDLTGVVSDVALSEQRLRVMDADTGQTVVLNITPDTIILNRNRAEISFASLNPGNIVDIRYDSGTSTAETVQISPSGWEHRMVRSVHINTDRRSVNIGASNYSYDDSTIVIYRNYRFDIERIDPIDVVTISGIRSRALFVEVNRSHGIVSFLNADEVRGGTIEVNTSIFRQLSDTEELRLLEGAHRIVIRGDNIEPMVREIVLANGDLIEIDLTAAQYRTGVLTINIPVANYTLQIDGIEHSRAQPIILPLDEEYAISVTADGHVPFLQIIRMTEPEQTLDVELTQLVEMGMLVVNTTPSGASVSLNGNVIGNSPLSHLMPFGVHSIVVRHEGYDNWTMQFDLNQARQEYQIVMTPSSFMPNLTPPPTFPTPTPGAGTQGPIPFPTPLPTPMPFPTPQPASDLPDLPADFDPFDPPSTTPEQQTGAAASPATPNTIINFSQVDEFAG